MSDRNNKIIQKRRNIMCFIGIITDEKSKKYINKIDKEQFKDCTFKIVYITDNNIENMKHIRFDTIVINKKINNIDVLRDILKSAKYIIIIVVLSVVLLGSIGFLVFYILKIKPRKKKANELDDDFDYQSKQNEEGTSPIINE